MFYIRFFIEKMSKSLISSFLVSQVNESLRSLTKNERCEQIAHSLIFGQKKTIRWENRCANSQP